MYSNVGQWVKIIASNVHQHMVGFSEIIALYQHQGIMWNLHAAIMAWCGWHGETVKASGGRLNKKDGLTRYGNSHVKDKTS